MSPYSAGILAHYSSSVANLTSLMTGGMPNLNLKFTPPDQYVGAFKEAYKLVRTRGMFLTWDAELGWLEASLSNMNAKPRSVKYDKELDSWEEWFQNNLKNFENLHRIFTAAGAGDVTIVSVSLEEFPDLPTHDQISILDHVEERVRMGLVM